MSRILFVDDEPRVLEGIRTMLRRRRAEWEMVFAPSPEIALQELSRGAFDIVVTDMRKPGMDGATLLARVEAMHPDTVRMVLSGHTEVEAAIRAVIVAHQVLAKPCDGAVMENTLERALALRAFIQRDSIRKTVGHISKLPSQPHVYTALMRLLSDPNASASRAAALLERDMAMVAKILQLVNSSFFGVSKKITRMEQAVVFLGFNTIKSLVLSTEVFQGYGDKPMGGFSLELLQQRSFVVANIAGRLVPESAGSGDAFMAAMLHDIGTLILAAEWPEQLRRASVAIRDDKVPCEVAEESEAGVSHAAIGAYLLGLWGLPYPIVEAVAYHHDPRRVKQREFDVLSAVYIADQLTDELQKTPSGRPACLVDQDYVSSLGLSEKLAEWRAMASEQTSAHRGGR